MVTDVGRVKVLDFGLAKYVAPIGEETETWSGRHRGFETPGALLGTLAYMSPEQARGGEIDARSDVFSLGDRALRARGRAASVLGHERRGAPRLDPPRGAAAARPRRRAGGPGPAAARFRHARQGPRPPARGHARGPGADRGPSARRRRAAAVSLPEARTVAVMSFANITGRPEDDWLGTGIAETVAADLKSVPGLCVVSRERVFEVMRKLGGGAGARSSAVRLGREVGAGLVVSGAYQRAGDRVRVTARVTETETGAVLQTMKADGRMDDVFALQDRIVAELSAGLRLHVPVTPGSEDRGDAERRGLRGLHEGPPELPGGDARVARPGHPLLRARGHPRSRLRARPRRAGKRLRGEGLVPRHARAQRARPREHPPGDRAAPALRPRLARARPASPRAGTGRRGDRGPGARARPRPRATPPPTRSWAACTSSAAATSPGGSRPTRRP